jgi:hypothetical protein
LLKTISFSSTTGTITKYGERDQYDNRDENYNDCNFNGDEQKPYKSNKMTEQGNNQEYQRGDPA